MLQMKDIRPRLCAAFAALVAAVGAGTNGVELADADLHLRYVPEARAAVCAGAATPRSTNTGCTRR